MIIVGPDKVRGDIARPSPLPAAATFAIVGSR
jgi:hypothetical protein